MKSNTNYVSKDNHLIWKLKKKKRKKNLALVISIISSRLEELDSNEIDCSFLTNENGLSSKPNKDATYLSTTEPEKHFQASV